MTDPTKEPDLDPSAGLLATAVSGLCTLPDAGNCAAAPEGEGVRRRSRSAGTPHS